jgi:hypothetical protein
MQRQNAPDARQLSGTTNKAEVPFSSNCVRLSGRELMVVGVAFAALFCFGPGIYERFKKFDPEPDYRLPYDSANDYWLYGRYCRWARTQRETLVIGDSVIWGHYVEQDNTLSHYLNLYSPSARFANMGVDGIHPAALGGLVKYYGKAISGKSVILHLNPLWMSSRKHDLQIEKEFHFNHPALVPQFVPRIPCYKAPYGKRVSTVARRALPFSAWTSHLAITYFEGKDLPTWTLEHPYENPLKAKASGLLTGQSPDQDGQISRDARTLTQQNIQWVELDSSLQWRFFRQSVESLRARDNTVFVLVGPFNEHMMDVESRAVYRKMQNRIESWLRQNGIPYCMAQVLPAGLYRDASHPIAEGYDLLAQQLFENESFNALLGSIPKQGPQQDAVD